MRPSIFLSLCAALGVNGASLGRYARVIRAEVAANSTYDFVIAGGGIAGLTVADRLTEDPNIKVLVIEYGPFDVGEDSVLVPGLFPAFQYLFPNTFTTPQANLNNRTFYTVMGGSVGGGSAINAMFFHRGAISDYANWDVMGASGWDWNGLLPYFKKSENFTSPDPAWAAAKNISWNQSLKGVSGPVHASYSKFDWASSKNFWEAAVSTGIRPSSDPNGGDLTGIYWLLRSLDPDQQSRSYSKINHYDRVINSRPNYHILSDHAVGKVLFQGKQAIGVEYVNKTTGAKTPVYARKEVIIAAGGIHSPQILQLSGVGPKALLQGLGINVVLDLPGVGQNLQDQLSTEIDYTFSANIEPNAATLDANATYNAEQNALYHSSHQGAYTLIRGTGNNYISLPLTNVSTPSKYASIIAQVASADPASFLPADTHPTVLAGYKKQRKLILEQYKSLKSTIGSISWNTGLATTLYTLKPLSRGTVNIASTDPLANPLIDYRSLSDPIDLETTLLLLLKARSLFSQPSMTILGPTEVTPGSNITDLDALRTVLKNSMIGPSNAHQCCTLAMADRELGGVVDSELRVYGVKGLSVVDVSRFTMQLGTAPSATVYAAAEKAAEIIKGRWGISSL
ncbi:choline dehydrogenase-like protein [Halenospora varia]|nr:choline dehydrogenase-like protein [Halenospora varia]